MSVIDLLFPKLCLGCGSLGTYLCPNCSSKLKIIDREVCFYCKKASALGLTHPGCRGKLTIDGLLSIYVYDNLFKKIIKNIKYRLATEVWREFIKTVSPRALTKFYTCKKILKDASIEPVPLSSKKFRERGFNLAFFVALYFKKILSLPINDRLVRKKDTLAQAQLSSKLKRYINLRGAFEIKNDQNVENETIIIIDDVVTTGATVKEAARVFKKAGVKKIFVFSLARG